MKSEHCSEPRNPLIANVLYKRKLLESWGRSTTQVPHKYRISTIQVQSLLNVVEYNTYSVKEMMELLNLKNRSHFSKEYLKPAVEMGMLEPIYPDQPRSPKQKYRLTEKGKAIFKNG